MVVVVCSGLVWCGGGGALASAQRRKYNKKGD